MTTPINDWTPKIEQLLRLWIRQCKINEIIYELDSIRSKWFHYLIGYPATIITAFTTTALFATYNNASPTLFLGMGVVAAIGALMQSIFLFGDFSVRSSNSHNTSSDYGGLAREGDFVLSIERKEARENANAFMRGFKEAYDKIYDAAPPLRGNRPDALPQISLVEGYTVEMQAQNTNTQRTIENSVCSDRPERTEGPERTERTERSIDHTILEMSARTHEMTDAEKEMIRRITTQMQRLEDLSNDHS